MVIVVLIEAITEVITMPAELRIKMDTDIYNGNINVHIEAV